MTGAARRVVLAGLPSPLYDAARGYLGDVLRECHLVLLGRDQGSSVDADASTDDTDDTIDEAIQEGQLAQAAGIPPCNLICGDPSGDGAVTVTDSVLAQN